MNDSEMKNYAIDLHELWQSNQLLEYARYMYDLYDRFDTSIILTVMEYLRDIQLSYQDVLYKGEN